MFTFVAFNRRFIPSLVRLKRWTLENPVRIMRAEMLRTNRMEPEFAIATGIHVLDTLRFLLGNPTEIEVRRRRYRSSDACDSWVRLQFANAAEAEISLLLNTGIKRETYRLTADGASAEAALGAAYNADTSFQGDRYWRDEKIVEQHPIAEDRLVDDGIVGEYEEFIRLVTARSSLHVFADGCRVLHAIGGGCPERLFRPASALVVWFVAQKVLLARRQFRSRDIGPPFISACSAVPHPAAEGGDVDHVRVFEVRHDAMSPLEVET